MLARNAEKGQIETFALSRFRGIEAAGSTFTRPADFDAQRYARQAFGITSGEKPIKVRLLFEPKLAVYVAEREWHPSQKLKHRADGRVEMRLETTGRKELVRWVLSWNPTSRRLPPRACAIESRRSCRMGCGVRTKQAGRTRRSTRTASKLAVGEQYRECKIPACLKEAVGEVSFG